MNRIPERAGADRDRAVRPSTAASALLALVLLGGVLIPLSTPARGAITVGPGVVFQPSGSWANLTFASTQAFQSVHVDPTGVTFDSVRFGVEKLPRAVPRAVLNISTWAPLQGTVNATSIAFVGASPTGSSVFLNFSGLLGSRQYILRVDGTPRASQFTDGLGDVSFGWAAWSSHTFVIQLGWMSGAPAPLTADFSFAPTSPKAGEAIMFSAVASGGTAPYAYAWEYGDGTSGSGVSPTHAFALPGTYLVNLTVSDSGAQITTVTHLVVVGSGPPPTGLSANFSFSPDSPRAGDVVTFTAVAARGTPPYTFAWEFGDGATGSGMSITHTYAADGNYSVALTANDAASHTVRVVKSIVVRLSAAGGGGAPSLWSYLLSLWPVYVVVGAVALVLVVLVRRRRRRRSEEEGSVRGRGKPDRKDQDRD